MINQVSFITKECPCCLEIRNIGLGNTLCNYCWDEIATQNGENIPEIRLVENIEMTLMTPPIKK